MEEKIQGDIMELVLTIFTLTLLAGGITAYLKNDYFSRGFFICLFTGIFGLYILIKSKPSLAKDGNKHDQHYWPTNSYYALIGTAVSFLIFWLYF